MDPVTIFFAIVAGFVCYRLYAVLGSRGGHEPDEEQRPLRSLEEVAEEQRDRLPEPEPQNIEEPEKIPDWMVPIREVYPEFHEREFLQGAGAAYEMIVEAFATGKLKEVKPYIDPGVYRAFEAAVEARELAKQQSELQFVGIEKSSVQDARVEKGFASITVDFRSNQIRVLRDENDNVIEGDPNRIDLVHDLWTFSRPANSNDPNWMLVATGGSAPAAE
jgi:predicted lipid-binding transport protein (Tim44 family)